MKIDVTCFASLSNDMTCSYDQTKTVSVESDNATARMVADTISIRHEDVAFIFINGKRATIDNQLTDGDRVAFVPAVGGM
jgi:molybdopterin converting factor small subunit